MKSAVKEQPKQKKLNIRPRVKMWLELDGERAFCPGVCQILRAIESTGSIKDAAESIGRSYRFVWGKLKQVEKALGKSLVETRVGGSHEQRSVLSPAGQILATEFEALRQRLFQIVDGEFALSLKSAMNRIEKSKPAVKRTPLR